MQGPYAEAESSLLKQKSGSGNSEKIINLIRSHDMFFLLLNLCMADDALPNYISKNTYKITVKRLDKAQCYTHKTETFYY